MKNQDDNTEIILSQWQTCVEMANSISQRRDTMNSIFLTLNSALLTAISAIWKIQSIVFILIGILSCWIWKRTISNFRILNTEKFNIINAIEQKLPEQPFNNEWANLIANKRYKDSTKIERIIPYLFMFLYISLFAILVIIKFLN